MSDLNDLVESYRTAQLILADRRNKLKIAADAHNDALRSAAEWERNLRRAEAALLDHAAALRDERTACRDALIEPDHTPATAVLP